VTLMLILALVLIGTSAAFLVRALGLTHARAAETRRQIDDYGYTASSRGATESGTSWPLLDRVATRLGDRFAHRLGHLRESELRRRLAAAGAYRITPRKFLGYRLLATIVTPVVWAWLASTAGESSGTTIVGAVVAAVVGWIMPMVMLKTRAERRARQIDDDLPELIDLLIVTIEAGLGFIGSMQEAANHLNGPLGDELRLTLQEQRMGLAIDEALRNMLARTETPAMRSFVRSILQGETLGVSIGQIMRNLADEMRTRRRQKAEERAQKAPVKILFPLIFLIFPAMFVILLGPSVFTFAQAFGHH
jgi:tight adherence protein C